MSQNDMRQVPPVSFPTGGGGGTPSAKYFLMASPISCPVCDEGGALCLFDIQETFTQAKGKQTKYAFHQTRGT